MECPNCKLINLPDAVICDCGYHLREQTHSPKSSAARGRAETKLAFWRLLPVSFILTCGNVVAAGHYSAFFNFDKRALILLVLVWVIVFAYSLYRVKAWALWLLLGAPFGVLLPMVVYVSDQAHVWFSYPP